MSAPTQKVRDLTYARDLYACVACGRRQTLTHQHRQASGMGGRIRRPSVTESLTLCADCNTRCESDRQQEALTNGWKVRRWVRDPALVPVFYTTESTWYVLLPTGTRRAITTALALDQMVGVYGPEYKEGARS